MLEVKWKTWYSELEPLRLCGCVRQMYGRSTTTVEAFKSGTELAKTKKKEMGAYNVRTFSSKKKEEAKSKNHRQLCRAPEIKHTAAAATCRCQQVASITSFLRTRGLSALATAVVVAEIIAFVSALALQCRGIATCQEETAL